MQLSLPLAPAVVTPTTRAAALDRLSLAAFATAALVAYGAPLLHADHHLGVVALAVVLAAAVLHLAVELRRRADGVAPRAIAIAQAVSWVGVALPVIGLRPLWPLALASVVATALMVRSIGERHAPLPAPAPVVASGDGARIGLFALLLAVAALEFGLGDSGGSTTLMLGASAAAVLAIGRVPITGWRRGVVVGSTILSALAILGGGVMFAVARLAPTDGAARVIIALVSGVAAVVLVARGPRGDVDLRRRALQVLATASAAAVLVMFVATPGSVLIYLAEFPEVRESLKPGAPWTLLTSLVAVPVWVVLMAGAGGLRDARAVAARLGLRRGARPALIGLGLGLLTASLSLVLPDLPAWLGAPAQDHSVLMGVFGIESAVVFMAGVAIAGVTEELLFRGLLQPRIGIAASSALFTAMHAFQYDALGLWFVGALSLAMGAVARRWGLGASIAMHVAHNVLTGVLLRATMG